MTSILTPIQSEQLYSSTWTLPNHIILRTIITHRWLKGIMIISTINIVHSHGTYGTQKGQMRFVTLISVFIYWGAIYLAENITRYGISQNKGKCLYFITPYQLIIVILGIIKNTIFDLYCIFPLIPQVTN